MTTTSFAETQAVRTSRSMTLLSRVEASRVHAISRRMEISIVMEDFTRAVELTTLIEFTRYQ